MAVVGGGVAAATVAKYLGALDYKAPAPPSMAPTPPESLNGSNTPPIPEWLQYRLHCCGLPAPARRQFFAL